MSIPGNANPLLLRTVTAAATGISRSLRFNSADSAYLSRTPASAGNRKTWTFSCWVKRSGTYPHMLGVDGTTEANFFQFTFETDDKIYVRTANNTNTLITTQVFRDYSAWYHVVLAVDTTQATSSNRLKLYVNGVQVTAFDTASYPNQNTDLTVNTTNAHWIGSVKFNGYSQLYSNGYLADIYFIDGQALDPTSFGEYDATTGVWNPKAYTGSYGTNGFHLEFADNSAATATTLGKDTSGNGNNWTPNNLSVTAGAGNDSLVDVPTNGSQVDSGIGGEIRGNYCTWNPLNKGSNLTISNGNLDVSGSTGQATVLTTIPVVAGMKAYMEFTVTTDGAGGWGVTTNPAAENSYGEIAGKWWAYDNGSNFVIINQTSTGNYSPRVNSGDVLQLAIDYSTGKVHLGINNTWINSTNGTDGNPATGANPTFTLSTTAPIFPIFASAALLAAANFGQRAFAYTAPSGFKALCTANLPAPSVTKPSTVFETVIWTGDGNNNRTISTPFSPDFVWAKFRNQAYSHGLFDTVRGADLRLRSNGTNAEDTVYLDFASNGFIVDGSTSFNDLNDTFVGWCWDAGSSTTTIAANAYSAGVPSITSSVRANATAGFSVLTATTPTSGSSFSVGHGLGVTPEFAIFKDRGAANNWGIYHKSITTTTGGELLFTTAAAQSYGWFPSAPTSTTFTLSVGGWGTGNSIVGYLWTPVVGYSSFGSYTGNGSSDGPFVYTGFRPKWVMVKETGNSNNWFLLDAVRSTYNYVGDTLWPNLSNQENDTSINPNTTYNNFDYLSNGFKLRSGYSGTNRSSGTYIYCAFAESPFNYARAR